MKRILSLALVLLLTLTMFILPAVAEAPKTAKCGVLLMLNMTEEEMANYYSDLIVPVTTKTTLESIKKQAGN